MTLLKSLKEISEQEIKSILKNQIKNIFNKKLIQLKSKSSKGRWSFNDIEICGYEFTTPALQSSIENIEKILEETSFKKRSRSNPKECACYTTNTPCHNLEELNWSTLKRGIINEQNAINVLRQIHNIEEGGLTEYCPGSIQDTRYGRDLKVNSENLSRNELLSGKSLREVYDKYKAL
jgi:hypothetical protein